MRIENIRRIIAIVDEGSLSKAAQKLYISQPTLSQIVKNAEDKLGTPIFERRAKRLTLTYAGEYFISMGRTIVNSWDNSMRDIQEIREESRGRITIGLTLRRGMAYLPTILPEFLEEFPETVIDQKLLQKENREQALAQRELDLILQATPIIKNGIKNIPLLPEQYLLIAYKNSPFARRYESCAACDYDSPPQPISIREACKERFILPGSQFRSRDIFNQIAQEANVTPQTIMEVANFDMVEGMVRAGLGVSIIPVVLTNNRRLCNRNEQLSYFFLESQYTSRTSFLCYDTSNYLTAAHRYFIGLIEKYFT